MPGGKSDKPIYSSGSYVDDTGGSGGGSYGGGSGGSGGGGGQSYTVTHNYNQPKTDYTDYAVPEDDVLDTPQVNAQLANLNSALGRTNNTIANQAKPALENIQNQRKYNAQQLLAKHNQLNRNSDWQPNQQKEQSTYLALRRAMGNSAYGSSLNDLNEGMARYDDMQDVNLINTWKNNQDEAYNNWYSANSDLISDYNEQVAKTNAAFDEAYNSYLSSIANIDSRLGKTAYGKNGAAGTITQKRYEEELTRDKATQSKIQAKYYAAKKNYDSKKTTYNKNKSDDNKAELDLAEQQMKKWEVQLQKAKEQVTSTTGKVNGSTLSMSLAAQKSQAQKNLDSMLNALTNKGTLNNPNIPDSGGIDYIRPVNASTKANRVSNGTINNNMAANRQYWGSVTPQMRRRG